MLVVTVWPQVTTVEAAWAAGTHAEPPATTAAPHATINRLMMLTFCLALRRASPPRA
jgi:hypothetical protein